YNSKNINLSFMENFTYDWQPVEESGAYEKGFVEIYLATIQISRAMVVINYLVQMNDEYERKALATIYLEGNRNQWTETTIKNIVSDIEIRIRNMEDMRFRSSKVLDYMTFQVFHIDNFDSLKLLTIADY